MKRKYYAYMTVLCSLLVFTGCDKESVDTTDIGDKVPISLSASSLPVSVDVQTRAETINTRTIGIVAVNTVQTATLESIDWSNYYLDHVKAVGTNNDLHGEKEVDFTPDQWWPLNPANYLAFVAYSPFAGTNGDSRVHRVENTNTLEVTANGDSFPDFLYTEPVGPYNKESAKSAIDKAISLGEFQHAMAKLVVRVQLIDKNGTPILKENLLNPNPLRIDELKIWSKRKKASFDLLSTLKRWELATPLVEEEIVKTHVDSSIPFPATSEDYTCFLLPGTEDESYVSIKVSDGVGEAVLNATAVSQFQEDPIGNGVKLEMGKTTLLTIKVKYVPIPDPEPQIILQGQLVEWDYKGKSEVVIE